MKLKLQKLSFLELYNYKYSFNQLHVNLRRLAHADGKTFLWSALEHINSSTYEHIWKASRLGNLIAFASRTMVIYFCLVSKNWPSDPVCITKHLIKRINLADQRHAVWHMFLQLNINLSLSWLQKNWFYESCQRYEEDRRSALYIVTKYLCMYLNLSW